MPGEKGGEPEGGRRWGRRCGSAKDGVSVLHRPSALLYNSLRHPGLTFSSAPRFQQILPNRRSSWTAPSYKPKAGHRVCPPTRPRKARIYTPPPASGCPGPAALGPDRTVGQSAVSPAPTALEPWGRLDQSCRRLTAGGSSIRTRITWRSSVPRSPGGGAGRGGSRKQSQSSASPQPSGVWEAEGQGSQGMPGPDACSPNSTL